MEKCIFLKNVSLGFAKRNVTAGETVQLYNGYAILNGQKITDLRDFDILKKYKFLVPYNQKIANQVSVKKEVVEEKHNKFGFSVKKESEQSNIIPLKKFQKAIQLNQDDTFVQQNGVIKDQKPQGVHVAKAVKITKSNSVKQKNKKQVKQQIKEQNKVIEKKDNKKNTKKTTAKNAKQQKITTVRGMKIIKEN